MSNPRQLTAIQRWFTLHTLKSRVILLSVMVAIFLALVLGISSYSRTQQQALTLAQTQHAEIARAFAEEARDKVERMKNALSYGASNLQLNLDNPRFNYKQYLNQQSSLLALFDDLILVNGQGTILASTNSKIEAGGSVADRPYFKKLLQDKVPVISEPFVGRWTNDFRLTFSMPVFDSGNIEYALIGVVIVGRNDLFSLPAQRTIGTEGFVFAATQAGTYLSNQQHELVGKQVPAMILGKLQQLKNRDESLQFFWDKPENKKRYITTLQKIESTPWLIGIQLPYQEIIAPLGKSNQQMIFTSTLLAIICALLTAALMTQSLRPLEFLRRQIEEMRSGKYRQAELDIKGAYELEILAEEFNRLLRAQAQSDALTKQTLKQLQQSTELLSDFYEHVPIGINLADENGHFIQANQAYLTMMGYSLDELLTMTYWDTNAPEFNVSQYGIQKQITEAGRFDPFEKQLITKDRRRLDVLVRGIVVRGDEGKTYTWSIVENITEKKIKEKQIQESEQRFRDLVNISSDWFWETDAEHRFTRQTAGGRIQMPEAVHQSIGKCRWELNVKGPTPEDWAQHQAQLKAHVPFYDFEYQSKVNDEYRWFSISGAPLFDSDGNFIGYRGTGRDIQQRKLNEQALSQSRERLRTIVDSIHDVVFQTDADGKWTYLNPAWEKMSGFLIEECLQKSCYQFIQITNDADRIALARVQDANEAHAVSHIRADLRDVNGELRRIELIMRQLTDSHGQYQGMTGTLHDITDSIRLDEERQHNARRLELENSLSSAMLLDIPELYSGVLWALKLDVDAYDCAIFLSLEVGGNEPECVAHYGELTYEQSALFRQLKVSKQPETVSGFSNELAELCIPLIVDRVPLGYVYLSRPALAFDQRDIDVANMASEVVAPALQIRILQDATDKARRAAEQNLQAMTDRFERAVAGANDGIWERNLQTGDLYVSPRYKQLLGYHPDEFPENRHRMLELVHPDDREAYETYTNTMISFGKRWQYDLRMQTKQGDYRWFRIRSSAERNEIGQATLLSGTFSDIHESKLAEEELKRHRDNLAEMVSERTARLVQARDEAEQANKSKSEFLANMSHELRTPMHAILSFAKFGVDRWEKAERDKLHHYFENIHKSGSRLLTLLNDLLDLSKLEAGKMNMDLQAHHLSELIQDAFTESEALAKTKSLELKLNNQLLDDTLHVDAPRMLQVIRNLLSNAIKFSPEGAAITVHLKESDLPKGRRASDKETQPAVLIAIQDEGIGIPESELEAVFDKFVQSSKTKTGAGGTGLGLAICREIVEAHQGKIRATNNATPDQPNATGASFHIVLPLINGVESDI